MPLRHPFSCAARSPSTPFIRASRALALGGMSAAWASGGGGGSDDSGAVTNTTG